jgi:hypothetical protein
MALGKREVALMLPPSIVFLGIRKFVYRIDFKDNEPQLVRQYVTIWLAGALISMRGYHRHPRGE